MSSSAIANPETPSLPPLRALLRDRLVWRAALLIGLAAIELPALAFLYDPLLINDQSAAWNTVRVVLREFVPFAIFFLAAFCVLSAPQWRATLTDWSMAARTHRWRLPLIINLIGFIVLAFLTVQFNQIDTPPDEPPWGLFALWTLGVFTLYGFLLAAATPLTYFEDFVRRQRLTLVLAAAAAGFVQTAALLSRESWGLLADATFSVSAFMISLYAPDVDIYPDERIIGVGDFYVNIASVCSGYEGIGLVLTFLSLYLYIFRASLRFPNVLWVIPFGVAAIWILNSIRIAALVSIGAYVSPTIAITGFHSQAGWMMFLIVTIAIMAGTHHLSFFRKEAETPAAPTQNKAADEATALLAPMMAMFAAGIIASAFSGEAHWLYGLRVAALLAAFAVFWRYYRAIDWRAGWEPVLLGALVGAAWIWTDPGRTGAPSDLAVWLATLDPLWVAVFLVMRVLGTVILVPVAEELAFRGYLHRKLVADRFETVPEGAFSWKALIVTSVLFGVIHQRWLAGALAGVVFAIALYRSGKISGAIIAHAVANGLIAFWAIAFGQWSLL
ncbi:MAG: exosortase E/protease, VPEID-CTERM system [Pseudomonadota bacterium]